MRIRLAQNNRTFKPNHSLPKTCQPNSWTWKHPKQIGMFYFSTNIFLRKFLNPFKWHVYSLSFKTLTLRMIFILCSCGHPCLRVWVGGFTFVLVSPWTSFVPTQTLSHPKLVWWNSPAGKHSHELLRWNLNKDVARMDNQSSNVPVLLLGH